jgi:hypothetical protein
MIETAKHLEAADHALREVCQSLLAVAAEDPSIYAVIQRLAEVGQEIAARKQEALKKAEGEEGMFVGEGI